MNFNMYRFAVVLYNYFSYFISAFRAAEPPTRRRPRPTRALENVEREISVLPHLLLDYIVPA